MSELTRVQITPQPHQSDEQITPEQSRQLREPGRVMLKSDGSVEVLHAEGTSTAPTPAQILSDPAQHATDQSGSRVNLYARDLNESTTMVPVPNGLGGVDRMPLRAALNAQLWRRGPNGFEPTFVSNNRPTNPQTPASDGTPAESDKPSQQQQNTAQQQQQQDIVPPQHGDESLGRIATTVGDAQMYAAISAIADGKDFTNADSIAQAMGLEPETVRTMHTALVEQYSEVGHAALADAGVHPESVEDFLAWARQQHRGELQEAFDSMVSQAAGRSTTKLKALGREFIAKTGGMIADAELEGQPLPEGAEWMPRQSASEPLRLRIKGYGVIQAQAALRQALLKW